ncbi:MAG: hypothetical protein KDD70_12715, partial [Bdellovibrionales bacterium]|nr:hypothetical protein [Bdellovibrionales bacterium]
MKRLSTRSRLSELHREEGVYIVFVALSLFALIGVAGLALEIGNIQKNHMRVRRAVDASALGASWLLKEFQSDPNTVKADKVRVAAERILADNLAQFGAVNSLTSPVTVLDASGSPVSLSGLVPRQIEVKATIQSPVHLLNVLPGLDWIPNVSATAIAGDVRKVVALLLDRSGSMG